MSVASDVCATCHGEPSRHARFQQWQSTGHSNYELALEEATVEGRGTTAANCGRCHSSQGFIAWINQGDLTKSIQGASGNATVTELTALGLTHDQVHPQTCATCHTPHQQGNTSAEPNTASVRLEDDVPMLPAGFDAIGVGRGATCIACHNTRNGAHNDNVGSPTSYSGPHTPAQGDMLMGQNAYFVEINARGGHSYLTDTCATCHMEETAPPAELSYYGSGTNHDFKADPNICSSCHGNFNGGTFQSTIEAQTTELKERMGAAVVSKLNGLGTIKIRAHDAATDLYSSSSNTSSNVTLDTSTNPIQSVELVIDHGQMSVYLHVTDPISLTWTDGTTTTTNEFGCQLTSLLNADSVKVYPLSSSLVKAFWNVIMIQNDQSWGVHNPSFAQDILETTLVVDLED